MSKKLKKGNFSSVPCDLDHNGECLICDCWISDCAWRRLLTQDFKYENREELIEMFKHWLEKHSQKEEIKHGKI